MREVGEDWQDRGALIRIQSVMAINHQRSINRDQFHLKCFYGDCGFTFRTGRKFFVKGYKGAAMA